MHSAANSRCARFRHDRRILRREPVSGLSSVSVPCATGSSSGLHASSTRNLFSQVGLYIQFYTAGVVLISGTNPNNGVAQLSYTNPLNVSTTIFLLVRSAATPSGCGDYRLFSSIQACPGDDLLENFDDCNSSLPLANVSAVQQRRLAVLDGDDDWFDIPLQPGERLDASIFFEHARADIDLYLRDQTGGTCGNTLTSGVSTTDHEMVMYTNNTNGPMDIAVGVVFFGTVNGDLCNDYELAYEVIAAPGDDPFENNDDICSPAPIDLGVFNDLIVFENDSDFYSFDVFTNERAKLAVDFTHTNGDIDLRLWDVSAGCANAILVDSSGSTSDYEEVEITSTAAGFTDFVLEVFYFPSNGGNNEYDLTVAFGRVGDVGEVVCVGQPNSRGLQGYTYGSGSASIGANDLVLNSQDLPFNAFGFFNTSMGYGVVLNAGGSQGHLCIAGAPTGRFVGPGQIMSSGAIGSMSLPIDLGSIPQPTGLVAGVAGDTWFFQLWHRDVGPLGSSSNFTGTTRVRLLP